MTDRVESAYDLFISYAEADRAWVEGYLLDALTQAGVRCHTEATFALGVPRLLEFERAVQQSQRTLLVLSPAYLAEGFTQFTDLLAQSYGLETATWPVIPLILQPVELPPRLGMLTALDATDPADWPQAIARLCADLQRAVPGPVPRPPCPYPGMVPFGEEDSERFFGREREAQELLERLRLHPFLTVIGPSGSGKSSLVFAGLLPALRKSGLFGPGKWLVRTLRPGAAPLAALQKVVGDISNLQPPTSNFQPPTSNLQLPTPNLLLVVDQFEELFTLARADVEPFQRALLRLAETPNCYVVLTVRADFYPDLMAAPLWPVIQAHRAEVLPLDEDGLRQAIVRPAEDVGVFVETALVERLIADASHEPGILPLVQETLVLLWEHLERRFLPLRAYEALVLPRAAYGPAGVPKLTGLQVAMARRADAALAQLAPEQQAIARRIFLRLVQFGEGRADTRRQQPVADLGAAGDDSGAFERTLEHLARSRLLTLSGEERGDGRRVDIAHEALITGWPTLQTWLSQRREAELTRRRLEGKAAEWVRLGRGSGGLLDEVELLEAERWLVSPDATDLGYGEVLPALVGASQLALETERSREEAARQRELALERRARQRLQVLVAVLGLLVLSGVGWLARQEYLRQSARAAGNLCSVPGKTITFECYEATNQRYALCVLAGRCSSPPRFRTDFSKGGGDLPVTEVDAMQAAAFCRWIGRRLPTRAEWTYAATQGGRTTWPWGEEEPAPGRANLLYEPDTPVAMPPGHLEPVGGRVQGATPEGIHDLIGNVWEWTITPWEKPGQEGQAWDGSPTTVPDQLIVTGGSYLTTISGLGTDTQPVYAGPSFRTTDVGFRCMKGGEP